MVCCLRTLVGPEYSAATEDRIAGGWGWGWVMPWLWINWREDWRTWNGWKSHTYTVHDPNNPQPALYVHVHDTPCHALEKPKLLRRWKVEPTKTKAGSMCTLQGSYSNGQWDHELAGMHRSSTGAVLVGRRSYRFRIVFMPGFAGVSNR